MTHHRPRYGYLVAAAIALVLAGLLVWLAGCGRAEAQTTSIHSATDSR